MKENVVLTVFGIPRTKKNSQKILRNKKSGKPFIQSSDAYRKWERTCRIKWITRKQIAVDYPVNCKAIFYREKNIGDAVNFYQGISDLLEKHGVVINDKFITQWDGSRLNKDKDNPRVEIILSAL